MRTRVLLAALLPMLCLSLGLAVFAADNGPRVVKPRPVLLLLPDLIVKQVDISRGAGEFPHYTIRVTVANIGARQAPASKTGICYYALQRTDRPMVAGLVGQASTPVIPAGSQAIVTITAPTMYSKMYLFVTADFPDATHQLGAVGEKNEANNVMSIRLDTQASFPQTFK